MRRVLSARTDGTLLTKCLNVRLHTWPKELATERAFQLRCSLVSASETAVLRFHQVVS